MNRIKKALTVLLSLVLAFSIGGTCAYASGSEKKANEPTTQRVSTNEYEAVKKLAEKPISDLEKEGFTSEEIAQLKDYKQVFNDHVLMLQKLSNEVLKKHGYNQMQIDVIRNFSGTEEQRAITSASATVIGNIASITYPTSSGRTSVFFAYSWYWTGIPAIRKTDVLGVGWNSWAITNNVAYASYYGIDTGSYYTSGYPTFTSPTTGSWTGGGHKIEVGLSDYYYAKSGYGQFYLQSDGLYQKDFYYRIEYRHNTVTLSLNFSVGFTGLSPSLSFAPGMILEDYKEDNYTW